MNQFQTFIKPFIQELRQIHVDELNLGAYPSQYLKELLKNAAYHLHIYANVLAVSNFNNREQECLLDFGTGNGLLACFAKYCGFKKVIGVDCTDTFLQAAKKLSKELKLSIDFFEANENNFSEILQDEKIDLIVGTDVIEHIYNLDIFMFNCSKINPSVKLCFTTASVNENYLKAHQIRKLQITDEYKWSSQIQSNYQYKGLSFLEIRKKIIQEHFKELTKQEIEQLALHTRGLQKNDIIIETGNYIKNKKFPTKINHPTNTCDPITGSWTERLLSVEEYRLLFNKNHFPLEVKNGFYNQWQHGIKNKIALILNWLIKALGKNGIAISPFIFLKTKP